VAVGSVADRQGLPRLPGKGRSDLGVKRPRAVPSQLLIVDYDALVAAPDTLLPRIFAFVGAPYEASFAKGIRRDSVKKADRLSRRSRGLIETLALPTYRQSVAAASSDFAG
jgi:hypothetical protein